jgi:exodeoxyribonuclease-3
MFRLFRFSWIALVGCFAFVVAFSTLVQAQSKLRVLSYNVLHGFKGEEERKTAFVEWVRKIDPDIVAFQELNGFLQNDLTELAHRYGHRYSAIMNTEFGVPVTHPLAITSRYPILNTQRVLDDMWHGYLYATVEGVHIIVTHLSPFAVDDRIKDVEKIIAQARLISPEEVVIIAGDMNAVSPRDSVHYGANLLASMQRIEGRLEPKSGLPIVRGRTVYRKNLKDGHVDYSVITKLLDAGYVDAFYETNSAFVNSSPSADHVGPTSVTRRIDYVFVRKIPGVTVLRADILQDKTTASLSDHYPVLVDLAFAGSVEH